MSVQLSSDKDYNGVLNDQTGKYEWIPRRTAEKYLKNKQKEINQDALEKNIKNDLPD